MKKDYTNILNADENQNSSLSDHKSTWFAPQIKHLSAVETKGKEQNNGENGNNGKGNPGIS